MVDWGSGSVAAISSASVRDRARGWDAFDCVTAKTE